MTARVLIFATAVAVAAVGVYVLVSGRPSSSSSSSAMAPAAGARGAVEASDAHTAARASHVFEPLAPAATADAGGALRPPQRSGDALRAWEELQRLAEPRIPREHWRAFLGIVDDNCAARQAIERETMALMLARMREEKWDSLGAYNRAYAELTGDDQGDMRHDLHGELRGRLKELLGAHGYRALIGDESLARALVESCPPLEPDEEYQTELAAIEAREKLRSDAGPAP